MLVGTFLLILLTLGEHLGSSEGAGGVLVTHRFSFRFLWCALYFLPFFFPSFFLSLSSCLFLVSLYCPFLIVSSFFLSFLFAFYVLVSVSCVSGMSFLDSFFLFALPSFFLSLSSCLFLVSLDCLFLIVSSFFLSFLFAFSVLVSVSCVSGMSFLDSFFLSPFLLFSFLCPRVCFLCPWIVLS